MSHPNVTFSIVLCPKFFRAQVTLNTENDFLQQNIRKTVQKLHNLGYLDQLVCAQDNRAKNGGEKMSATDLMKEWKKRNPQIENVVLFVCNALRWDYTPKSVLSRGIAFKTIASGIMTCASFPSIVTGLYPQHHGVHSFHGRIPRGTRSLLNLYGYNTSLWTGNILGFDPPESALLYRLLRHRKRFSLEDLDPPFVYLEDHRGGHCPYGWSAEDEEYEPWDCMSFFRDFGRKGEGALRKRYLEGIQISVREFDDRMHVIDERGLADETLVVFLSDHGELLGERGGIIGHGNITVPEVVYVPTVFIHPDLPKGKSFEQERVLRHVGMSI